MDFISPSPLGLLPPGVKLEGLHALNGTSRKTTNGKKNRTPVESHKHFLGIVFNEDGSCEVRSSANLKHMKHDLCRSAIDRGTRYLQEQRMLEGDLDEQDGRSTIYGNDSKSSVWQSQPQLPHDPFLSGLSSPQFSQMAAKRRRTNGQLTKSLANDGMTAHDQRALEFQNLSTLKQPKIALGESFENGSNITSHDTLEGLSFAESTSSRTTQPLRAGGPPNTASPITKHMISIKMGDREKWYNWFTNAFKAIQQQACRSIAKEWIKEIHPKKQSTHPYNGNHPRIKGVSCPELTRPPYWPTHVLHKEPDHINKEARTSLLVHVLMKTPQREIVAANTDGHCEGKEIRARDLLETLIKKREEFKDKWEILECVIDTRTSLERFEEDEFDADTLLSVPDFEEILRARPNARRQRNRPERRLPRHSGADINYENDTRVATPASVSSPMNSRATLAESEYDDNMSALTASFSSDTTQVSSRSRRSVLRPRPQMAITRAIHPRSQANVRHQMLVDSPAVGSGMGSNNYDRSIMSNMWTMVGATHPHISDRYANDMMMMHGQPPILDPSYMDHGVYTQQTSAPTSAVIPVGSFNDSQQFYSFDENMHRNVSCRDLSDMASGMDHDDGFLHDPYLRLYDHSNQHRN